MVSETNDCINICMQEEKCVSLGRTTETEGGIIARCFYVLRRKKCGCPQSVTELPNIFSLMKQKYFNVCIILILNYLF